MGKKRVLVEDGTYHVMSRIAHREFFLGERERGRLVEIVRRSAFFCGVEVLAHAVLSNHFHVLVHVPPGRPLELDEVLARYAAWKGRPAAACLREKWREWTRRGLECRVEEERRRLEDRMFSLSKFMQMAKEWCSSDYNARTGHTGTLWERVFKSVLVEASRPSVTALACYIDLNCVRAGMAATPGAYPWSSFGDACRASSRQDADPWADVKTVRRRYMEMYGAGSWSAAKAMHAAAMHDLEARRREREEQFRRKGRLREGEHLRIRAFTDGVVVGSRAFVREVFSLRPEVVSGARRTCSGCRIGWLKGLYSLREIRDRPARARRDAGHDAT